MTAVGTETNKADLEESVGTFEHFTGFCSENIINVEDKHLENDIYSMSIQFNLCSLSFSKADVI